MIKCSGGAGDDVKGRVGSSGADGGGSGGIDGAGDVGKGGDIGKGGSGAQGIGGGHIPQVHRQFRPNHLTSHRPGRIDETHSAEISAHDEDPADSTNEGAALERDVVKHGGEGGGGEHTLQSNTQAPNLVRIVAKASSTSFCGPSR